MSGRASRVVTSFPLQSCRVKLTAKFCSQCNYNPACGRLAGMRIALRGASVGTAGGGALGLAGRDGRGRDVSPLMLARWAKYPSGAAGGAAEAAGERWRRPGAAGGGAGRCRCRSVAAARPLPLGRASRACSARQASSAFQASVEASDGRAGSARGVASPPRAPPTAEKVSSPVRSASQFCRMACTVLRRPEVACSAR